MNKNDPNRILTVGVHFAYNHHSTNPYLILMRSSFSSMGSAAISRKIALDIEECSTKINATLEKIYENELAAEARKHAAKSKS